MHRSSADPRGGCRPRGPLIGALLFLATMNVTATPAGTSGDRYGEVLAADADTLAIGVPAFQIDLGSGPEPVGAVFVYARTNDRWVREALLTAPPGFVSDSFFGASVALSGDRLLVGHPAASVAAGTIQGAAHLYERTGATWTLARTLSGGPDPGADPVDNFGAAVALAGDTAVVGAPLDDVGNTGAAGSVYVYTRSGSDWTQSARLVAADAAANHGAGAAVALSGNTVLVGTLRAPGVVHVWVRNNAQWGQQATLSATDQTPLDSFGQHLAVDGDLALVGATLQPGSPTVGERGAVYAFRRNGANWTHEAKLQPPGPPRTGQYGRVALLGERALVGAPTSAVDGIPFRGQAYLYERGNGAWPLRQVVLPRNAPEPQTAFGQAVALAPGLAFIGAPTTTVDGDSVRGVVQTCIGAADAGVGTTLDSDSGISTVAPLLQDSFEAC